MREAQELLDGKSPADARVFQVTEGEDGAHLIYPDTPCFLIGGRRFVFGTPQGHRICDLDAGGAMRNLFPDGRRRRDVTVYPDGSAAAFVEHSAEGSGTFSLWRFDVETSRCEEIFHAEGKVPGVGLTADKLGVSTVSSDGRRFATTVFLGDGTKADAPFGIVVIDTDSGEVRIAAQDRDFHNSHLQYCRSMDPIASHDLLIQMNHGSHTDESGRVILGLGPPCDGGADVHVVRDNGANWRDLPWGRDGRESCIGHQMWRGGGRSAVTVTLQNMDASYGWADGSRQEVVAGWPVPADKDRDHIGRLHPGARRVLLSEGFGGGRFCHLTVDASGLRLAFDTFPIFDGNQAGMLLYVASAPDELSPLRFQYVLNTGMTFGGKRWDHAHPVLSPGGGEVLFNSTISGWPQIYMVSGMEY
jgi:hypothetical protein